VQVTDATRPMVNLWPIVDDGYLLVGIITQTDLIRALNAIAGNR
jgi:CBS-domain-containing membrane protein